MTTSAAAQALYDVAVSTRVRPDGGLRQADVSLDRPEQAGASWTTAALVRLLYRRCYLGRSTDAFDPENVDRRPAFAREDAVLGAALRAADGGRWIWESGWSVDSDTADGAMLVNEHGLQIHARRDEFRPARRSTGAATARIRGQWREPVDVRFPTARPYASPGFFLVSGTAGLAVGHDIVRWYLDLESSATPGVLRTLVRELDGAGLRYTFKVLSDPAEYPRPDAAVLYASRADLARVHAVVLDLHDEDPGGFRPATPMFSRRVRDGIGIAEDPPHATVPLSFGQHRCRLVAKGLIDAGADADGDARFRAIVHAFDEVGISVDAPHLNPGSPEFDLPDRDGRSCAA